VYTKVWSKETSDVDDGKAPYDYQQVYDDDDYSYSGSASFGHKSNKTRTTSAGGLGASGGFSLLKSSQRVINIFKTSSRNKQQDRKLDSLSTVNLMVPINEDDEAEYGDDER